uniref:Disks large homolog 5 n=1 Tax=Cacopsylla melanoneura TaxID=428564 RepID=A0A8D8WDJ1_9HEMI
MSALNKYETIKDEYDALRKRFDDLINTHSTAVDKLQLAQEEVVRIKKQCEDMNQEKNTALRERNGLKQQCTAAIRQWDIALRERNEYQEALAKVQQQHEDAVKEINTAMAVRMKASKDLKRLTEERNAAMQEYSLIMSERDSVHKEMEKLSEDLTQAVRKIKTLEIENKDHQEEKKTLSYQIETLKREISSALHDRDKALKECNDLRERFGEFTAAAKEECQREAFHARFEYAMRLGDSNSSRKERSEVEAASMDLFGKCQKERMDNLDQANQEIDRLRKHTDKLQAELQESIQEAEVSKRRRDWAFSERDKIVLERESIRTLCDKLRKERDRAVSDLAEALRDSDNIKKLKNETSKELKVLKEKMEAQVEKESRMLQLHSTVSHNYSHDSAIDTDMQEWETEVLDINLTNLSPNEALGLELVGGRDDPFYPNDSSIYVSNIVKGSVTDGKLKVNDCIVRVNNLDCSNVSKRMVLETVRSSGTSALMVIRRRRVGARSLVTTQLQLNNYDHGLTLAGVWNICKISPGSLAAKEGSLAVGDRVLSINNRTVDGLSSAREGMALLNDSPDVLTITTLKPNGLGDVSPRVHRKSVNSSTQTMPLYVRYSAPTGSDSYQVPKTSSSLSSSSGVSSGSGVAKSSSSSQHPPDSVAKPGGGGGKWDSLREKMAGVRRRVGVEDKRSNRTSSPPETGFEQEQVDAIAELDSVIDSYHSKHGGRHKRGKELDKNGGTWPKARSGPMIENGTGTILHPRRHKERLPLSVLLNNPPSYNLPACCRTEPPPASSSTPPQVDHGVSSGGGPSKSPPPITPHDLDFYAPPPHPLSHSPRIHSQLYSSPPLYSFTPFTSLAHNRYPSPSQSGDSLSLSSESRSYCFEPPYTPQFVHTHSPSDGSSPHYHKALRSLASAHSHPGSPNNGGGAPSYEPSSYHSYDAAGTFPRKKENQRFRIPSNPSVAFKTSGVAFKTSGTKMSNGSIEKTSERGSPMPTFHVEVLSPGLRQNKRNSLPDYCCSHKPHPGELRRVHIDKSVEPLGIQIQCLDSGGVFVSTVSEHSLASQVGLQVGDQLLEVCGINMRSATYQLAASVLRQCGNSITMLVQYSPDKYHELEGSGSSSAENESVSGRGSGSPTPCNSPGTNRKSIQHNTSTLTRSHVCKDERSGEPRFLMIETRKCSNLGISLVGGNAVGIYVHSVQSGSLGYSAGLRTGDRILEYNGTDLRAATAEEAAYELAKPADKVTVLAQYSVERYNEVKDKPGDSFYMRALFSRTGDLGDALQLRFHKDDILYVDNTMFNGVPGHWRAWLVDADGFRQQCGIIPSKYKVEEELLLRRSLGDLESDARRATRRSFFRRKKHQRSDSKELASFSNINLGWYSDSGTLNEDSVSLASYQRVIRLNSEPGLRPVIIVGALSDTVTDKLLQDFPDKFVRCAAEIMHCPQAGMEKGLADNLFVDYKKKGAYFECTSVAAVKDACDKNNAHVILDVSLAGVERLHRQHVYPIVLLIKFKSTKQIKEIRDGRYSLDKVTAKAAKEMYEHGLKIECEHRHYISAVIPAGVNIAYMCTQIQTAVELEQSKTLWVPSLT